MKTFILAFVLFSSSAFSGEMVLTENYSITVNLADSAAPDNSFSAPTAPSFVYVDPTRWTTTNTVLEVAFQVLNIIDWGQTRYIALHPRRCYSNYATTAAGNTWSNNCTGHEESESAWIIGEHPSTETVDTFMILSAILHPLVSYLLPSNCRAAFQYITIGDKLNATVGNATIGIKMSF
ncbi:MAG: hypothetical protein WC208_13600 [Gallionella sp.]|jgi:hypothetical protein